MIVVEVLSGKATIEVEAGRTVKEVLVQEGDEARVGDVIARLDQ